MSKRKEIAGSKRGHVGRESAAATGHWEARDTNPVAGGCVVREAKTGRFIEVKSPKGVSKISEESISSVERASAKRGKALKRLADR